MDSGKAEKVIAELKRRVAEVKFGDMTVVLKIHEGEIVGGEITNQTVKLG